MNEKRTVANTGDRDEKQTLANIGDRYERQTLETEMRSINKHENKLWIDTEMIALHVTRATQVIANLETLIPTTQIIANR